MSMTELTNNIREELAELQKFTATPGSGVTRFPFTEGRHARPVLICSS